MDFSKSFIPLVNVNAHYQVQTNHHSISWQQHCQEINGRRLEDEEGIILTFSIICRKNWKGLWLILTFCYLHFHDASAFKFYECRRWGNCVVGWNEIKGLQFLSRFCLIISEWMKLLLFTRRWLTLVLFQIAILIQFLSVIFCWVLLSSSLMLPFYI
jgi:hypothetical protein